jgi:hypothetical protein
MALSVPTRRPVPPLRTQQPARTFLGACVDEALEQRENPWDPARFHREWVEQKLNELAEALVRSEVSTRPLQPIEHRLVQILVDMPRGDLLSLPEKVIEATVKTRLRTEHKDDKFGGTALWNARNYVLYGELPRRRR